MSFVVDKLGIYKDRSGDFVEVTEIRQPPEDAGEENTEWIKHYPIIGKDYGDVIIAEYEWTRDGHWSIHQDDELDLVEYISIEDHPEMYI